MTRLRSDRLSVLLAAVAMLSLGAGAMALGDSEPLPKPPEPNPADPVDYVKWWNDATGAEGNAGAAAYAKAAEAWDKYNLYPDPCWEWEWVEAATRPWSDDEFPGLKQWLHRARPALDLFRQAAAMEDARFPRKPSDDEFGWSARYRGSLSVVTLDHLTPIRSFARALAAEALEHGQAVRVRLENVATILAASDALL